MTDEAAAKEVDEVKSLTRRVAKLEKFIEDHREAIQMDFHTVIYAPIGD
jgi:hypothetical protein